jgi:transposase
LHKKIQHWVSCVKALRVFVGIEIAGCYHDAIGKALEKLGYDVSLVNSCTTALERKMMLDFSKTDDKDLLAIALAIIANKGVSPKRVSGFYEQMQAVCRTRRRYVTEASALKTQIRELMSMVFREFQGLVDLVALAKQKVFGSFWSPKSRLIMRYFPLPDEILNLKETGLKQLAATEGIRLTEREIELLLWIAF